RPSGPAVGDTQAESPMAQAVSRAGTLVRASRDSLRDETMISGPSIHGGGRGHVARVALDGRDNDGVVVALGHNAEVVADGGRRGVAADAGETVDGAGRGGAGLGAGEDRAGLGAGDHAVDDGDVAVHVAHRDVDRLVFRAVDVTPAAV